jgi:hypothetical protein
MFRIKIVGISSEIRSHQRKDSAVRQSSNADGSLSVLTQLSFDKGDISISSAHWSITGTLGRIVLKL